MKWEPGKEYRTRDGRRARVYATDGSDEDPIHGAVLNAGAWRVVSWDGGGHRYSSGAKHDHDLMPPRQPVVVSETVLLAYLEAMPDHKRFATRAALAAAIEAYLAERGE